MHLLLRSTSNFMYPGIMSAIFKVRDNLHYHLRHSSHFGVNPIHGVGNGTEQHRILV